MARHKILDAYARIDDEEGMTAFLMPIHASGRVRDFLARRPGGGWGVSSYDAETRVAQLVLCNGGIVACYAVTDVTLEQAGEICAVFEKRGHLTAEAYKSAVEAVLDASATSAQ